MDNFVRYLTQVKHPVQDVGRPIHVSPDLQKIQQIVNQIKNIDFFNLDDEETTVKNSDEEAEPMAPSFESLDGEIAKRSSRNAFDNFSETIKKVFVKKTRSADSERKQKRKSSGLFGNVNVRRSDKLFERPIEVHHEEELSSVQEPQTVAQPSEDERLVSDLNNFQSRLNAEQQIDISNFLEHIRDKPKPFKFDTTPFLLTQMEKLSHPTVEQQEDPQDDEDLLGARKFFDFNNSPVKRSLFNNEIEDYQKIAKLKSKLVAEYREHHPIVDYSEILRRLDASNSQKLEKVRDDFLDHNYRLNDGSSSLDDVMKPFHSDQHVMSPYELNLSFQLDNQFKELDTNGFERDKSKGDPISVDVPLYKPEIDSNADDDNISP